MSKENFYIELKKHFDNLRYKSFPLIISNTKILIKKAYEYTINNTELVIKILIPVLIIGIGYFLCSLPQKKILKSVNELFSISDEIRLHYSQKPDYWGLSTSYVVKNNILSNTLIKGNQIILSNGKELLIGSGNEANVILPRSTSFDLVVKGFNKSDCILYLETQISQDNLIKLNQISLQNDNGVFNFNWGDTLHPLPVLPYVGRKICSETNNTIIWTLK